MESAPIHNPFASSGLPALGAPVVTAWKGAPLTLARFRSQHTKAIAIRSVQEDAYTASYQVSNFPAHELWLDGKHRYIGAGPKSSFNIFDHSRAPSCRMAGPFDHIHFHIPRAALDAIADEANAPRIARLHAPQGWNTIDPVFETMHGCILDVVKRPAELGRLFVDHMMLALHAHVARTYGGMRVSERRKSGGLAPWQERRARDFIADHLAEEVSLEQIAAACNLSTAHFSRAFKVSTGVTPHEWLQSCRVARAKDLLRTSKLSLAEIALVCGFADQSHFTKVFTRTAGDTPGAWRRYAGAA